jgi:signal-transduction protein with cAMP-binding, CBS, and nucleotidyltransferase domain
VKHLPVVESGQCVGLVSLREIVASRPSQCLSVPVVVGELCRRPPPVVQSRAGTDAAIQVMKDMNNEAVVVLAGVEVFGVTAATSTVDQ